jgi:uncharacterized protein (DUF1778 family)
MSSIVYALNKYMRKGGAKPRVVVDDKKRMNLRLSPERKATLTCAAVMEHSDLTGSVLHPLSERDSLLLLNLLENPPAPNAKLRAAIAAMPKPTRNRV